jgi:cytochrome subunit of sulfide dehydrogenase
MHSKHVLTTTLYLALGAGLAQPVLADTTCRIANGAFPASVCDSRHRTLTATCYNCHGPNGMSQAAIPALAGQDKAYLVNAMKQFRSGERQSTVMQRYAMGYTDEEYEAMANLFATMQINLAQTQGAQK